MDNRMSVVEGDTVVLPDGKMIPWEALLMIANAAHTSLYLVTWDVGRLHVTEQNIGTGGQMSAAWDVAARYQEAGGHCQLTLVAKGPSGQPGEVESKAKNALRREGFPHMTPAKFVAMYTKSFGCEPHQEVTRIEFRRVHAAPQTKPFATATECAERGVI